MSMEIIANAKHSKRPSDGEFLMRQTVLFLLCKNSLSSAVSFSKDISTLIVDNVQVRKS